RSAPEWPERDESLLRSLRCTPVTERSSNTLNIKEIHTYSGNSAHLGHVQSAGNYLKNEEDRAIFGVFLGYPPSGSACRCRDEERRERTGTARTKQETKGAIMKSKTPWTF